MKTWIGWMSRIAGGMLFQGGYVTSPTMLGRVTVGTAADVGGSGRKDGGAVRAGTSCPARARAELNEASITAV